MHPAVKFFFNPGRKTKYTLAQMMGKSPDVQFGIRFSTWDIGSMSGKWDEISETLKRRCVDICCLQEVRWRGHSAKMIGNGFKFVWSEGCKAENGVGVIVANWLIGKVVGAERFNDRVMKVNIVIGDVIWKIVSCYSPRAGRSVNEKEEFCELMGKVVTMRCWWVETLTMLVQIWVVLERFMEVLGLGK